MNSLTIGMIVFICVFGGALIGMFLCPLLPNEHRSSESKDVVRMSLGLVTMTVALVLGLLVASAKSFYDSQNTEIIQSAANYLLLDRILSNYGPGAAEARASLRDSLGHQLEIMGTLGEPNKTFLDSLTESGQRVFGKVQELLPEDDNQRMLKTQAITLSFQLGQTRWLMFEQNTVPVPRLLLFMLIFWLFVLFLGFGIFAPRNLTVLIGLFISAAAVSGAILVILEMYHPQTGLIRVSDAPLRAAMAQLMRMKSL